MNRGPVAGVRRGAKFAQEWALTLCVEAAVDANRGQSFIEEALEEVVNGTGAERKQMLNEETARHRWTRDGSRERSEYYVRRAAYAGFELERVDPAHPSS